MHSSSFAGVGGRFDIHIIGAQTHRFLEALDTFLLRPDEFSALFPAPVRDDHRGAACGQEPFQIGPRNSVDPELDKVGQKSGTLHPLNGRIGCRGGDGDADHGSSSPRG
jgi:hypothetical protein